MGKIHDAARDGKLEEVKTLLGVRIFLIFKANIDEQDRVGKRMSS